MLMKKNIVTVFFAVLFLLSLAIHPDVNSQITYPTPSWDYSPITPRVGDTVVFDASDFEKMWNEKGESTIVSLDWHFGDGAYATGALVNHVFTSSGTYFAGVTATDDRGYGGTSEFEIEVREQTPITIYLSLNSESIYTGQEVILGGNLTYNGTGVPDAQVSLSSKTYVEGAVWQGIASVKTDAYGKYSAVWKPTFGYYQVKAAWAGNASYPETSVSLILIVKGFGNFITEFSSNSTTISDLNFNATTRVLSFSAEGPSGTNGYVTITLEKDPSFDPQGISVLLDGQPLDYTIDSTSQSWLLSFTYTHSVHNIVVNFDADELAVSSVPQETIYGIAVAVSVAVIAVGLLIHFKKRNQ